jgi:hypothetical protein
MPPALGTAGRIQRHDRTAKLAALVFRIAALVTSRDETGARAIRRDRPACR